MSFCGCGATPEAPSQPALEVTSSQPREVVLPARPDPKPATSGSKLPATVSRPRSAAAPDALASTAKAPAAPAQLEPVAAAAPRSRAGTDAKSADAALRSLLARLQGAPEAAEAAYRELWELSPAVIPKLLLEVENRSPTPLRQLDVLILQKDFHRYDPDTERFHYHVLGLGRSGAEFDDIALGKTKREGAVRARLRKFGSFELGVVIRAGLLNRLRSARFPSFADQPGLVRWWQEYYKLSTSRR